MVLRDLDGGHISTVSYDSNAPVEKTLSSFAVNLSSNPTFSQVLNQARGETQRLSPRRHLYRFEIQVSDRLRT